VTHFEGDLNDDLIIGDGQDVKLVEDYHGNRLLLFSAPWSINWVLDKNKARGLELSEFGRTRL
jgi:peptide chain release factor 3